MKRFLLILCLLTPLLFTGCGTTPATKAAQAEQILINSVNDATKEWAAYVNAGKAKQSQINAVKTAYNGYYTAQLAAKAVIEKAIAGNSTVTQTDIDTANTAVTGAETALVNLINSFLLK